MVESTGKGSAPTSPQHGGRHGLGLASMAKNREFHGGGGEAPRWRSKRRHQGAAKTDLCPL